MSSKFMNFWYYIFWNLVMLQVVCKGMCYIIITQKIPWIFLIKWHWLYKKIRIFSGANTYLTCAKFYARGIFWGNFASQCDIFELVLKQRELLKSLGTTDLSLWFFMLTKKPMTGIFVLNNSWRLFWYKTDCCLRFLTTFFDSRVTFSTFHFFLPKIKTNF